MHIKAHTTRKNTKNLSIVQNNLPRPPDQLIRKAGLLGIGRKEGYHYSGR